MPNPQTRFVVLVYRMPPKPTAGRVGVWRQLKKIGAIYLQQSVCVFPVVPKVRQELQIVLTRIEEAAGEFHLLPLRRLSPGEERKLVDQFLEQTSKHYQEIIENAEVNFQKEIEFETFRKNFTYEEAEEIRAEFEKIVDWFNRVRARDWFGAPNRDEAAGWLERCEGLVEEFEGRVFAIQETDPPAAAQAGRATKRRHRGRRPDHLLRKPAATVIDALPSMPGAARHSKRSGDGEAASKPANGGGSKATASASLGE